MRRVASFVGLTGLVVVLSSLGLHSQAKPAQALDEGGAPIYKVDPFWPKWLPNKWGMQQVTATFSPQADPEATRRSALTQGRGTGRHTGAPSAAL